MDLSCVCLTSSGTGWCSCRPAGVRWQKIHCPVSLVELRRCGNDYPLQCRPIHSLLSSPVSLLFRLHTHSARIRDPLSRMDERHAACRQLYAHLCVCDDMDDRLACTTISCTLTACVVMRSSTCACAPSVVPSTRVRRSSTCLPSIHVCVIRTSS
jgi:hypothetical protein